MFSYVSALFIPFSIKIITFKIFEVCNKALNFLYLTIYLSLHANRYFLRMYVLFLLENQNKTFRFLYILDFSDLHQSVSYKNNIVFAINWIFIWCSCNFLEFIFALNHFYNVSVTIFIQY